MLPDVLTVNAGSTSVKLTRRAGGRDLPAPPDLDAALAASDEPAIVIHRVVHGGHRTAPEVLDDAAVRALRDLTELAPLHQPPALDAIDRCRRRWPEATQIACFDTSFHSSMPAAARTYALPARLREWVQVYGFHGLSHAWASASARRAVPGARRVLVAHGTRDPRVPIGESEQFVAALQERQKPVTYLTFDYAGHGFIRPDDRRRIYAAVAEFFTAHLR